MKKIVLINQDSGYLMVDIANAYSKHYDKVVLMAGRVSQYNRHLYDNIKVQHIIEYNRKSKSARIFTSIWASVQIYFNILIKYYNYELVYVTNPLMGYLCSLFLKNEFSVIVFDIAPDGLIDVGISRNNWAYKWWERQNVKLFARARQLITISKGMAKCLSKYVVLEKIKIVNCWPCLTTLKRIERDKNPFILENQLLDKFVVMYSGNIGYSHKVETIIDVAKKLINYSNICFVIIGDGGKKPILVDETKKSHLCNVSFLPRQSEEKMIYSLSAADLGVVTLNANSALLSVPSKTYNLLAVGAPLLCIAPETSEISDIVKLYNNGKCFDEKSIDKIAEYIIFLSEHPETKKMLSDNSLTAASHFSYKNAEMYL